jgi:hypothetical protein
MTESHPTAYPRGETRFVVSSVFVAPLLNVVANVPFLCRVNMVLRSPAIVICGYVEVMRIEIGETTRRLVCPV